MRHDFDCSYSPSHAGDAICNVRLHAGRILFLSKGARVTQFLDRLDVIQTFLVRHGISGTWQGLVIVLLLICWFLTWKDDGDNRTEVRPCTCQAGYKGVPD